MKLSYLQSKNIGNLHGEDYEFLAVSTDTRTIQDGQLFVALKGKNFDAHDMLDAAIAQGASAVVVEKAGNFPVPHLVVDDTTKALGKIGHLFREEFEGCVIAVTGSCGKTTVKGMLIDICSEAGTCIGTKGNLNNQIGVPLTLFGLSNPLDFAIVEAGTSYKGEIGYLKDIISPDVSVAINAMPAHLEGFGSVEAIAVEKADIYDVVNPLAKSIVNLDDAHVSIFLAKAAGTKIVGFTKKRDQLDGAVIGACEVVVFADSIQSDEFGRVRFNLSIEGSTERIFLKVIGEHNVVNALAAASAAFAANVPIEKIKVGLEKFEGAAGRMQVVEGVNGTTIIDDSYNANPGSMKAAIDYLAAFDNTILICGDMAELGDEEHALHQEVGDYAQKKNIKNVLSVGKSSEIISRAFGSGEHFKNKDDLVDAINPLLMSGLFILVKGSRSARMEDVVNALALGGRS